MHLGLGSFFRAHQAWYTDRASDADGWGIAAFTGRRPDVADALAAQDGLYTLVTRGADTDDFAVVRSVSRAYPGTDHEAWLHHLGTPDVRVVTLTVTEAGYRRGVGGGLDTADPRIVADLAALRADPAAPVSSAPARLVAGLLARRYRDAGPLTLVPCDNLPGAGSVLAAALRDLAADVDSSLPVWIDGQIRVATTVVDRITPRPTDADRRAVLSVTGVDDRGPVVTEPFSEWVLAGEFPGGRPAWESAGAVFTDDVTPFEDRKLWLLNGAHSLLAYAGPARGHATVAEAVADPVCRGWLGQWWDTCGPHLALPAADVAVYREALLARFANPRIRHELAQIAADGSQKLPARILPVLRRERAHGRLPGVAVTALAAWVAHLRGAGPPVTDVRAAQLVPLAADVLTDAVPRLLATLDPALPDDADLVGAVKVRASSLAARAGAA
ncbi:mannitol dehydrogenase family protein [Frankia sp. CNm7]|uniref:mannitol dehydrogenase family protein n=1 Tax=Frankia nepalensis TaxID=1836974 RepID=UPI001E102D32|nr:mannitol dehydrogenase family protein [Frankia nepalensis]MBL7497357.1 mannitol dehydrogenase family protein [Frankia nepalensis]MBL7510931.1 mannitol dehydrogenase family protein [Frankia nepalensis]MBL7517267.1 mannitol dehydrogenase family protein [Frankia nepalensis]